MKYQLCILFAFTLILLSQVRADCSTEGTDIDAWCYECSNTYGVDKIPSFCTICYPDYPYLYQDLRTCKRSDCTITPEVRTSVFCFDCEFPNYWANGLGTACTNINCDYGPVDYSAEYCSVCEAVNVDVLDDESGCTFFDCDSTPENGSYSNGWCQKCYTTPVNALEDKSGCIGSENSSPQTNTPTSNDSNTQGIIISVVSSYLLMISFI